MLRFSWISISANLPPRSFYLVSIARPVTGHRHELSCVEDFLKLEDVYQAVSRELVEQSVESMSEAASRD